MKIDNKKILIGAGILVVGYLLYKKNQRNRDKQMECNSRYSRSPYLQMEVVRSPEQLKKHKEEWMKANCK